MSLRRKVLWIVGLTLVCLMVLGWILVQRLWMGWFAESETREVLRSLASVDEAINADLRSLDMLAADYAGWDDTADFIEDHADEAYIRSNFVDATFVSARLNLLMIFAPDGRLLFAKAYDLVGESELPLPPSIRDLPVTHPLLLEHADASGRTAGLLVIDDMPMLVVSRPVTRSDRTGPVRGTLVMGVVIDGARRESLATAARQPFRIGTIQPASGPDDDPADRAIEAGDVRVEPLGPNIVAGWRVRRDILHRPAILISIESDREIHRQGRRLARTFLAALLAIGLVFALLAVALLEHTVVRRVSRLGSAIGRIRESSDPSVRLPVDGRDEIGSLAVAINRMLATLERSQEALRYIGRHARCLIWTGTLQQRPDGSFPLETRMLDEEAAQQVFPVDLFIGGSYAHGWRRSVVPEDAERVRQAPRDAVMAGATSYAHAFRVRSRDGAVHWFQEEVSLEQVSEGVWRLVGVCTDVTAGKHAEEELSRARDAALEVARMKSEFLANMSHEIRTPLNGILGMTEVLRGTALTAEQRECLDLVRTSAESLLGVINDVLDFSRIEAGRLELDSQPFDLRLLVEDALGMLAVRAQQKALELVGDIAPDVPSSLVGDGPRLRQIIVNLVGNAIKFTERGEVVVTVEQVAVDEKRLFLDISVRDTGIGIPRAKQARIFRAFEQADSSTTRRFGGTGLGLAISAELAERMHGRIRVESEPEKGSVFSCRVLVERDPSRGAAGRPGQEPPLLVGRRVVVADPSASVRRAIRRILEDLEMEVAEASGAADLPAVLAAGDPPDALLLAARLGDGDGVDIARRSRTACADGARILLLSTALNVVPDVARARDAGLDGVVPKPIRRSDLLAGLAGGLRAESADARSGMPGLRVLVADDESVNREVALRTLERIGWRVDTVPSGRSAIERIRAEDFDLVLLDLELGDFDGFAVARTIRDAEDGSRRRTPIIAMTGHADPDTRARCIDAGMDGHVAKPINVTAILTEFARAAAPRVVTPGTPAGPPGDAAPGAFDRAAALARLGGDEALLREIADLFLRETPGRLDDIRSSVAERDPARIARLAHALVGATGNFGDTRLLRAARALESLADRFRRAGSHGEPGTDAPTTGTSEAAQAELLRAIAAVETEYASFSRTLTAYLERDRRR
ncbi:MAG: response regulator [Phycisphaeraceae bacterium]|nr:response regulator [Phycisphaeraceae bacterium]